MLAQSAIRFSSKMAWLFLPLTLAGAIVLTTGRGSGSSTDSVADAGSACLSDSDQSGSVGGS